MSYTRFGKGIQFQERSYDDHTAQKQTKQFFRAQYMTRKMSKLIEKNFPKYFRFSKKGSDDVDKMVS